MAGAEPYSAVGDGRGALVLHGFTGNPHSVRGVAMALADAGLSVELPLLPGHGTEVADMLPTRWSDWTAAVVQTYVSLAARCEGVVVVGLSMGGLLALWLAERHPEISGLVLVNPMVLPPDESLVSLVQSMIDAGEELAPGIGSDIAMEGVQESSYAETPLRAARSLFTAAAEVSADLESVVCPVLLFTSAQDHVVDPVSSEVLVARLTGPVEQVRLERSFHVATLDWDRDEIEARTVEFATAVLSSLRS
jgi:carboxylesterase